MGWVGHTPWHGVNGSSAQWNQPLVHTFHPLQSYYVVDLMSVIQYEIGNYLVFFFSYIGQFFQCCVETIVQLTNNSLKFHCVSAAWHL